jgi:hypothetical protein
MRSAGAVEKFSAPWGRALWVISAGVTIVMLIGIVIGTVTSMAPPMSRLMMIIAPILILAGAAPFMIFGYEVEDKFLVIRRLGWSTRISLAGLQEAFVKPNAMKGSIRLFGNGGMFSITGWFWNRALGRYRTFVTDLNRTVVLRFTDQTIVVSPDAPEPFVQVVKGRIQTP